MGFDPGEASHGDLDALVADSNELGEDAARNIVTILVVPEELLLRWFAGVEDGAWGHLWAYD